MKKITVISTLLLFFLIYSCRGIRKDGSYISSINISYIKGFIEKPTPFPCGAITPIKSNIKQDTLLIDKQDLNEIGYQLIAINELKIDSNVSRSCDVRMQCKINFKNKNHINLCIGEFNCLIVDGVRVAKNDTLVYLIRKYSGYYNYFPKEDLDYFNELKQYGIPADYKDLSKLRNLGLPSIPLNKN